MSSILLVVCCVGSSSCEELIPRSEKQQTGIILWYGIWKYNICSLYTADLMNVCYLC